MLTQLNVRNFKSLYDVKIPLKKLNIFVGPNNSGKSSILHVLLFLKQSYDNRIPTYHGSFNFHKFDEVIYNKNIENVIQIILEQTTPEKLDYDFKILGFTGDKIKTDIQIPNEIDKLVIKSSLMNRSLENGLSLYDSTLSVQHPYFEKILSKGYSRLISGSSSGGDKWFRFHRSIKIREDRDSDPYKLMVVKTLNESIVDLNTFYSDFLRNITFIPVERGSMEWFTQIAGSMPKDIHTDDKGNTLFNALFHMIRREHSDRLHRIKKWTVDFGIHELTPYPVDAKNPSCGVETLQDYSSSPFQLISMGFGTRQVLFLVVKALLAKKESLILIEEPEIHLHPAYQTKIIDFFIELVNNDEKQILVTTHSEYLLLRIQNSILRGEIEKEDVGIYYVDIIEGRTKIKELPFTKEGSFEMPGFYDVTQQEYKEWLQLKMKKSDK